MLPISEKLSSPVSRKYITSLVAISRLCSSRQKVKEVYEENVKAVYKYLFCLTHNADLAEELTQETFYQAAKGIDHFRGECKVSVWLCQIAKRLWYKELERRKYKEVPIAEVPEEMGDFGDIENDYLLNVEKVELFRLLHNLVKQNRYL